MTYSFQKATKENIKLRMALYGPPGCGKTYTALQLASCLGKRIGLIDTEYGSSRKYADLFDFEVLKLSKFGPSQYYNAIASAEESGFDYLIIDSLSHAWYAELEAVGSDDRNWARIRPLERQLWDKISSSSCHMIVTMRSKVEYVHGNAGIQGITTVRMIGTNPIQREGCEYDFDICGLMDDQNTLTVSKSRCHEISGGVYPKPAKELANTIQAWLNGTIPPSPTFIPSGIPATTELPVCEPAKLPESFIPINIPETAELTAYDPPEPVMSINGQTAHLASTNGHGVAILDPTIESKTSPAKAAFKALLSVTNQTVKKVSEASIELFGADDSGLKPKFSSENMTAAQIKSVCEALIREWLGGKGYTPELGQHLIDTASSKYPGQYAAIARDIANQIDL
jgi:DNA polymerase III delta prime subunit